MFMLVILKMIELRSEEKKLPIKFNTIEEAIAVYQHVLLQGRELFITGELKDEFDVEKYQNHYYNLSAQNEVDIIILLHDLAQLEQKEDFSIMFAPILSEHEALVTQYKSGNEKALNALLGKFLKSNKGYDPKEVKEELIKLLE